MSLTVLLIEDNPGDARLLQENLKDADVGVDFRLEHVPLLEAGLGKLTDSRFDLVMLDLKLPDAGSRDPFTAIHERFPQIPVVVLTGRDDDEAAIDYVRRGAQDYVVKGNLDGHRLAQSMYYAIERSRLSRAAPDRMTHTVRLSDTALGGESLVPGYRILHQLGAGSMARVYLAQKAGCRERYALKIMKHLEAEPDETRIQRFLREAEVAARVRHPHVVRIYEFGLTTQGRLPYIVMEYVDGRSLDTCLDELWQRGLDLRLRLLRQTADALDSLHEQDICHRDIKPANLMLAPSGEVKLTDFGIAQIPDSCLTMDCNLLGSPAYMSPEAFRSPKINALSDIFSLGVVAYELLLGQRPFRGQSVAELAHQIQFDAPLAPTLIDPAFPPALQNMLAKMLKKQPAQRYRSMALVRCDIDLYLERHQGRPVPLSSAIAAHFQRSDWSSR